MTKMILTDLERALDKTIHNISELTTEQLVDVQSLIERAQVHVMIERHLRSRVASTERTLRSVT